MAISAKSKILASDINTALSSKQDALGYTPVKSVNGVNADAAGNVAISVPATPKAYVTATYSSGANWYRKWSDGFIEQGGQFTISGSNNSGITQSLVTAFSKTNYIVNMYPLGHGSQDYQVMKITTRNTSSFVWTWYGSSTGMLWYAAGY